ncbi:hypothetical protein [Candidatus Enterococcus lemimoniae]|uniref:Uncharacterized protein n=1 Tax=Candidatus Enterococcus lemimoniae TaxID=1834167 RepID=A0ABZ2T6I4_9ENTE|nr:hypothetical protein [Enterococcus sp. 12C11_DIV0727]OTO71111.1 hypothetical protein A5866_003361 [Enterococcus sp. 12C11_DIV0727]
MTKEDKEKKEVISLKSKLVGWATSIFIACLALNIAIKMLAEIWLPLLFLALFIVLLVVGYQVKKIKDWR